MSRTLAPIGALLMLLVIWFVADKLVQPNVIVFPGPSDVYASFAQNFGALMWHTAVTVWEAMLGFLLAAVVGYALAILFVLVRPAEYALYPLAVAIKAMPLVALAPILVVWLGQGMISKVVMAALVAFFPVLVAAVDGLRNVPRDHMRLFASFRASQWQRLTQLQIPTSLDSTFAGLKIGSTLAVVGSVIAEFTGANAGIGYLIKLGAYNLDTPLMFAAVICIGAAGSLIFAIIAALHSIVVFWSR